MHLGLADVGGGDGDAVMTRHGELETAAERMTVNGGNERLLGVLEPFQARMHRLRPFEALLACLQLLEDVDVRAGDECRARADQDDRVRGESPQARSTASLMPSGTPALRAFTGGLSTVTTATRSRTS